MEFDQIKFHLDQSATIRLLRSDHSALALGFFQHAFKKSGRIQIPMSELASLLDGYIEHLPPESRKGLTGSGEHYINQWCSDKHRFLRRYYEKDQDEPITELTFDTERALEWMWTLEKKEFVGTQSRFGAIFEGMRSIVQKASTNPAVRINHLKSQRLEIDSEIREIEKTGQARRMDDTLIREKFLNLMEDARRLISDFSLVEDIFKELTTNIKKRKIQEAVQRGIILGEVLDAYDMLEESDQGKSFDAFWQFLLSTDYQDNFKTYVEELLKIPEIINLDLLSPQRQYAETLKRFKNRLLSTGQKVLKSKTRLSAELRRLLERDNLAMGQELLEGIQEIKKTILEQPEILESSRETRILLSIDYLPKITLPLERPLWKPSVQATFADVTIENGGEVLAKEALGDDLTPMLISELERKINAALENQTSIRLSKILESHPVSHGMSELIGYFVIGGTQFKTAVLDDDWFQIPFMSPSGYGQCRLPEIEFQRQRAGVSRGR